MKKIISAGDSVTAKLVEEAGFDGIWVSGFEACARLGLPDNGSITMHEMLNVAKPIVKATRLPVYVDVDTGYGNFDRTVRDFEDIGVAGISVEDNLPNKENSLFGGEAPIENADAFVKKISVPRRNIEIIARTEALIRGHGMVEAEYRAERYCFDGGADYVMIHTRDKAGQEHEEMFAKGLTSKFPLVIVPTKFPYVKNKELETMGFKMVIWANQTERVKIKAIRECLERMNEDDNMYYTEKHLSATLEDMKALMPDV